MRKVDRRTCVKHCSIEVCGLETFVRLFTFLCLKISFFDVCSQVQNHRLVLTNLYDFIKVLQISIKRFVNLQYIDGTLIVSVFNSGSEAELKTRDGSISSNVPFSCSVVTRIQTMIFDVRTRQYFNFIFLFLLKPGRSNSIPNSVYIV